MNYMLNAETKRLKILIVDDDEFILNMYSHKMVREGLSVEALKNADGDFVNKVVNMGPDLIMMDINFPGCQRNGVMAAGALQLDERTKSIPIIFLTNAESKEEVQSAQQISSIGFLIKTGYIPSQVVSKVREMYAEFLKKERK